MEPVGFAVGVIALAGLFNNAVDCFEYVQLGRNFSSKFQTNIIRLDNARLRLSRWGQAVGVGSDLAEIRSLDSATLSQEDIKRAEEMLGQIQKLFADAEGISTSLKAKANSGDSSLDVLDTRKELDALGTSLHEKMRALSIKRQDKTSLTKKVKWALYKEKDFNRLLEDVIELVDDLVGLFPAARPVQLQLCDSEIREIDKENLLVLQQSAAAIKDKDLEAVISRALESSVS
jgi:hypothetical protein